MGTATLRAGWDATYQADFEQELSKLEKVLKALGATLETSYDDSFIAQKREALLQHGVSLLTIQVEPHEVTIH